ncbi:tyrosine-type recombinase/integrase [Streptomyces sp. DSM 44915]|uniref:Tyrosine-type recombinase/integrase n=1 Tax=Streptomyces chisholmiae TaxID=3075540 RepID=A0ABU2JZ69_9ACTN|nr:tyrosine-type recombinase/integrase [Streptomyces sp. DSM 44915]MDT0270297.1 tyrosine-type recombinase/integrase [Streptomyces sp. DSM 44915]
MGELLDRWLDAKGKSRRSTTVNGYGSHVRVHLRPALASYRADRLSLDAVQAMFDGILDQADVIRAENAARRAQVARCRWTKPGRPPAAERAKLAAERERLAAMPAFRKVPSLASVHAIRRSLRAAINWGMRRPEWGITYNPAEHVDLTPYRRPRGLLWTEARVKRWRETGEIPSRVMVWSPAQLGAFLDAAEGSRLYAAFHLIGYHGLRRGEAVGQDWANLDSENHRLAIAREIVQDGWTPVETETKTEDSAAAIRVDAGTVSVLLAHQVRQVAERAEWDAHAKEARARGEEAVPWVDTGKMFTKPDGTWLHPDDLSTEFRRIRDAADLPPINLRDLRHGAAGLVKASGGDLEDAKRLLRHSTITLTSDTYMVLFEEAEEEAAAARAAVVPRARIAETTSVGAEE